jgi:hypothetical protein
MEDRRLQRALPVARLRPTFGRPAVVGKAVKPPMPPAGNAGSARCQIAHQNDPVRRLRFGAPVVLISAKRASFSRRAAFTVRGRNHVRRASTQGYRFSP